MKMNKLKDIQTVMMVICLMLLINACNTNPNAGNNDETPTRGTIKIGVDESFSLLLDSEIFAFQSVYTNAHITAFYKPETDILNDFLNDSIRLMVTTFKLTTEQEEYLRGQQIIARTTKIAYDALAFIVNRDNPDSLIQYPIVNKLFTGEINQWNQINNKNKKGQIKVVFDNEKSGNIRYFNEYYKLGDKMPNNFRAVKSNEEVIKYVEITPGAIGIISVNWISNKHDSISHTFLNRIRVVGFTSALDPDGDSYYRPYQAYIADKSYPFIRDVYMVSRETFSGLGSGFIAYVAGDIGQRIILKSRLVPATMPIRLIKTREN